MDYGRHTAVCGVNLDIPRHNITAIVGPSGSGKSTVLLSINRLLEAVTDAQVNGQVIVDGNDVYASATDLKSLRRRVGTVFQRPTAFPLTIFENIAIPLKEFEQNTKPALREKIEQVLIRVGLWDEVKDRLHTPAQSLSGGQMQRLCIARALALNPEVLLLDEPCSALDPLASRKIEDLLLSLRGEKTIVTVTHNLAQARRLSDYVALFWPCSPVHCAGTILEFSPTHKFFERPEAKLARDYIAGVVG